jgi:acetoin utilization protein AcuC
MAPYSTDDQYAYAFESAIEPILRAYDAEFYIVEAGADAHVGDPLTHMQLSSYGWMSLIRRMLAAAGDKPLIVLGGGGYDVNAAVRLWTMVYTALAGIDVPNETPAQYAKATEITNLHDQPHQRPVIARDEYDLAWEYVKASVEQLKRWVGDRYGL